MNYFIIYNKDKFLGYTTNKKLLNNFLNNRKGKYHVNRIKDTDLPEDIKNSSIFYEYELNEYIDYSTTNDTVLFNYERDEMERMITEDAHALNSLLSNILDNLKYFKLSNAEKKIITCSFKKVINDLEYIIDGHEVIFDEIINIRKYFYKRYLASKK